MDNLTFHALAADCRLAPTIEQRPRLLVAGATGVLGNAMVRQLVGMQRASHTWVLARLPMRQALHHVSAHVVPEMPPDADDFAQWPLLPAEIALIMFDPPRMFYGRERSLWTPSPLQLAGLGDWLRRCGVHTLVVVLPHDQGTLPEAVKRGLANLDEEALARQAFTRLLIVRTARKPQPGRQPRLLQRTAAWMLGVCNYMVPHSAQPVRAAKVAEFVDEALQVLPAGIHVAAPELVWGAAQGDSAHMRHTIALWLRTLTPDRAGANTSGM